MFPEEEHPSSRPDQDPPDLIEDEPVSQAPRPAPTDDEISSALDVIGRELAARPADPTAGDDGGPAEVLSDVAIRLATSYTSGPMPSAREMGDYKAVDSALPLRIADAADEERGHRHELETRHSKAEAVTSIAGVFGGISFVVLMLALARLRDPREPRRGGSDLNHRGACTCGPRARQSR